MKVQINNLHLDFHMCAHIIVVSAPFLHAKTDSTFVLYYFAEKKWRIGEETCKKTIENFTSVLL